MLPSPPIVQPDPSLSPVPVELGRAAWGADLVDRDGNRWAICACHHLDRESALGGARRSERASVMRLRRAGDGSRERYPLTAGSTAR